MATAVAFHNHSVPCSTRDAARVVDGISGENSL